MSELGATRSADLLLFWNRVSLFLRRERKLYAVASVFEILTLGSLLLYPQLIKFIVDEGIESRAMDRINELVIVMAAVLVVQAISAYLRKYLFELAALKVSTAVRQWLFGNIVVQELTFFDGETAGELMARLSDDVAKLTATMRQIVPDLIHFFLLGGIAAGLMVYTAPLLSMVVFLVGPAIWGATALLGRRLRARSKHQQDLAAELNQSSLEAISAIETVRVFHAEQDEVERHAGATLSWWEAARGQARGIALLDSIGTLFTEGAVLIAIWVGGMLIVGRDMTPGSLVSFVLYSTFVMRAVKSVAQAAAEVMRAQGGTERVFALGERTTRMPIEGGATPDGTEGVVRLEEVGFRYPTRPDSAALAGVNLEIPRGEVLALVGTSGSGKSTIARLIARLYDPDSGRVTLDGRDLRELDPGWLRRQITLVPAEAVLFARSISDNIRYGRPDAKEEEVREAARSANARAFIEALPEGYASQAGSQGTRLSSGQRQRIAIARALLMDASVLILDEATAALDSEGEARLKQALRSLPHRPTIIMVSHRLSTVADADRVVLVRDGRIADMGTHAELLETSKDYRDLIEKQLLSA